MNRHPSTASALKTVQIFVVQPLNKTPTTSNSERCFIILAGSNGEDAAWGTAETKTQTDTTAVAGMAYMTLVLFNKTQIKTCAQDYRFIPESHLQMS